MGAVHKGAALPWGSVQAETEPVERDLPVRLGLALGSRIEVRWELSKEEEEEGGTETIFTKWWGAVLERRLDGEADGEGRQVYQLSYDPDTDNGFEEREARRVTFLEDHSLFDLSEDAADLLCWRCEGDAWEPPAEEGEGEGVSLHSIVEQISAAERRRGRTMDEDAAEALAELPPEQQTFMAAGFRNFADAISAELSKLAAQHGTGYIVTEADMRAATAAAMQAAMRGLS